MNGGGILKTKKIFDEKRIYQLSYIPPKTDFQEYIIGYKKKEIKNALNGFCIIMKIFSTQMLKNT